MRTGNRQSVWASLRSAALVMALAGASACGGAPASSAETTPAPAEASAEKARETPPASAAPRDVKFPAVERFVLANGLEVNVVPSHALPIVYASLIVKSGGEANPPNLPRLSHLVAAMLEEGTKTRTSVQIAEEIEYLGSSISVGDSQENITVGVGALKDTFEKAFEILGDVALNPVFSEAELKKLKTRENDRLTMRENDPKYLARREFSRAVYGAHPYAIVDTTKDAVKKAKRADLVGWHKKHFVPSNAALVVVGDVTAEQVKAVTERVFGAWKGKPLPAVKYPSVPERTTREIIVVDRPGSEQSVIYIGNVALRRASPDYVPLLVANQVLGGAASSRLFMDLREKRSLSYGAYSTVDDGVDTGTFIALANVRNDVTKEALAAFLEHLDRIVKEAPPEAELREATRFLTDRFPLDIDSARSIAGLVSELRIFGLPDDYWETYRSQISRVTPAEALGAATKYIQPDRAVMVVVGKAEVVVPALEAYGKVTVVDRQGKPVVAAKPEAAPAAK